MTTIHHQNLRGQGEYCALYHGDRFLGRGPARARPGPGTTRGTRADCPGLLLCAVGGLLGATVFLADTFPTVASQGEHGDWK